MALSGSFRSNTGTNLNLRIDWSATQDIKANSSEVTVKLYAEYRALYVGARSCTISIEDSSSHYSTAAISEGSTSAHSKLLATKTMTLTHASDGTRRFWMAGAWNPEVTYDGKWVGTIDFNTHAYLDQIDRTVPNIRATITKTEATSFSLTATSRNGIGQAVACDLWEYKLDSGGWIQFGAEQSTTTSKNLTITGLQPNTSHTIRIRARRTYNHATTESPSYTVKTLGVATLNSASALTADVASPSFTINWTTYTTDLQYSLELRKGSSVLANFSLPSTIVTKATRTITLTSSQRTAILNAMSTVKGFKADVVLITKNAGATIGSTSRAITVSTTAGVSGPTLSSFTYSDTNNRTVAITEDNQILIQGQSDLSVIPGTASAKNGAYIVSYDATIGGTQVSAASGTIKVGAVNASGTLSLTVRVVDSRGYTAQIVKQVEVIPYEPIKFQSQTVRRRNEVDEVIPAEFSARISPITIGEVNKNALEAAEFRTVLTSSEGDIWENVSFEDMPEDGLNVSDTYISYDTPELTRLDTETSWYIQLRITDKLTSDSVTLIVSQGIPLIKLEQKKVGINTRTPQAALDVVGGIAAEGIVIKDHVVEQGTSGIWMYRKWASGMAECWGQTQKYSEPATNDYITHDVSLPFTFTSRQRAMIGTTGNGGYIKILAPYDNTASANLNKEVQIVCKNQPSASEESVYIIHVIGRWKNEITT